MTAGHDTPTRMRLPEGRTEAVAQGADRSRTSTRLGEARRIAFLLRRARQIERCRRGEHPSEDAGESL